jgi:hypothetical protein
MNTRAKPEDFPLFLGLVHAIPLAICLWALILWIVLL